MANTNGQFKRARLTNVVVDWAQVHLPDKYGNYSVTLRLDDKNLKELTKIFTDNNVPMEVFNPKTKKMVSRIRTDDKGRPSITLRRKAKTKEGKDVNVPVVDSKNKAIPKDILIGNGSRANINILLSTDPETGESSPKLAGTQILELVHFTNTGFEEADGFTLPESEHIEDDPDAVF